jgi:succinoglycan biosynthesis protein ExoA
VIVVVDGHCELEGRDYLANLADAFRRSGADCVGRPQPLDVTGASTLQKAIAAARSSWLGHHPDSFIYSGAEQWVPAKSVAVAYRRDVFDQVGGFDERFDACEDVELNHRIERAGLRCFFTPAVRVRYFPRSSLRGLFRQMARYGQGRVRLLRKHRDTFSPGGFVPAAWVAGLLAGPTAGLAWSPLWWAYGGVISLYLATVLATSAVIAWRHRQPRFLGWLPLVFLTLHAASGWGALSELSNRSGHGRQGPPWFGG